MNNYPEQNVKRTDVYIHFLEVGLESLTKIARKLGRKRFGEALQEFVDVRNSYIAYLDRNNLQLENEHLPKLVHLRKSLAELAWEKGFEIKRIDRLDQSN